MNSEDPLPKREPKQALAALWEQLPPITPWPISPGVSGWFHPPAAPEEEWPANGEAR